MDIYLVSAMQAAVSALMFVAFDFQRRGLNGRPLAAAAVTLQVAAMVWLVSSL